MNENHIPKLLNYAVRNCEKLALVEPSLESIVTILRELLHTNDASNEIIDDRQASALTKSSWQEFSDGRSNLPLLFSDRDIDIIEKLARKFLELASDTNSNNECLTVVARQYLNPLLSQDLRTNSVGWDMGEYIDWYFRDTPASERQEYANKLLSEWLPILHYKELK